MHQSKLSRRSLPPDALRYARDQLWVARGLGPHLKELLTSDAWDSWTFADPSVPASRLERFSTALAIGLADVECHAWKEVATVMTAESPAVWLAPDSLARPGDGILKRVTVEQQFVDDGVYLVERAGDVDRIAATWGWASSAAGQMGLVTTHVLPASGIDAEDLRAAAEQAVLLVMTAYDGDGIIFFRRRKP
ncbi:MAG TPA: hypothetical protein VF257_15000 [Solirubrobacteraceae bacterium]